MAGLGGGIFVANANPYKFRPNVQAVYDALWQFKKEGILEISMGTVTFPWIPGRELNASYFKVRE